MGLIGWSGVEMTFMVNIIVFLLLAVSMASSIHIMSRKLKNEGILLLHWLFSWWHGGIASEWLE